jgi:hypothetical protein
MRLTWVVRRRWTTAHALRPGPQEDFLGQSYARTLCGLRVPMTEASTAGLDVPRCVNCTARISAPL